MSVDERLMILQMVADKKLTASEAAELLKALDPVREGDSAGAGFKGGEGQAHGERQVPPSGSQSGESGGRFSAGNIASGIGTFIEEVVDRVHTAFSDATAKYTFPSEVTGEFTGDEVPLRIVTGNGRVSVQGWDEPTYRATVVVNAKGANEAEALQRSKEAFTVKADENGFDLEAKPTFFGDVAVHVTLMVPKSKKYRLETRTGNGRVDLEDVRLVDSRATTGNGRVHVQGGCGERLTVKTGNGNIEIECEVGELEAHSGNGSLQVRPTTTRSQKLQLATGNGSIRVLTGRLGSSAAYKLEGHTGIGSVTVNLPNLVYDRDVRSMAHKQVIAHSENFDQAESQVVIVARTGMGSITFEP